MEVAPNNMEIALSVTAAALVIVVALVVSQWFRIREQNREISGLKEDVEYYRYLWKEAQERHDKNQGQ